MGPAQRPPHPGTRPEPFAFPDDAARRAAAEARDLAASLRTMASQLDADTQDLARGGFSGVFATWVFARVADRHDHLRAVADDLDHQADQVDALRLRAHHAGEVRDGQIDRWDRAYWRWRDWQAPVGAR